MWYSAERLWKTLDMKSVMWVGQTRADLVIRALFVEGSLQLHDSYITICYFGLMQSTVDA